MKHVGRFLMSEAGIFEYRDTPQEKSTMKWW